MVRPENILDPAKVGLAARALVEQYGDAALARAIELERESDVAPFAAAVRQEVEKLLKR